MAQFARPNSTISAGSWTPVTAATLHEATDDVPSTGSSDTDEASSLNNGTDVMVLGLSAVTTPAAGTVTMRWSHRKGATGGETIIQQVELLEGSTVIANYGPTAIADAATFSITTLDLSTGERDSITDWSNLSVRITRTDGGGANRNLRIGAFELETPDAGGSSQNITNPALLGGSTQHSPTVVPGSVSATPGLLGGAVVHAPTLLAGSIATTPVLLGGASLFAPTLTTGSVSITPDLLGGASVFDPTVVAAGESILVDLLGGATLFAPTVAAGQVTVQTELLGTAILLDPALLQAQAVATGILGGASLFAPSVFADQAVLVGLLGGATLLDPTLTVGSVTVVADLLGGAVLFAPTGFLTTANVPGIVSVTVTRPNSVSVGHEVVAGESTAVALGSSASTVELGAALVIYHSEDS